MKNCILTTTPSFTNVLSRSELGNFLKEQGIDAVLQESFTAPFSFDPVSVFGMVSGAAVQVGREELKAFPNLKIIMPFGVGVDHIDTEALIERNIDLRVFPGINKNAVAELAIAFLFALARDIVSGTLAMRGGRWDRTIGSDIEGKVLGIIGLGNIGKEVAKKARALGMSVQANDIVYDESFLSSYDIKKAYKETIFKTSDFISLHVPLTDRTHGFINKDILSLAKKGAFLINTSRGEVMDEKALLASLESGVLGGAALDVFSQEPPFGKRTCEQLLAHPRLIATPHNASFTPGTHYTIAKKICEEMSRGLVK